MTTLLDEAKSLIYGDRAKQYGPYEIEAQRLAVAFSLVLGFPVKPEKIPLLMVALKMVRLSNDPTNSDSWVDIAGYAGCAGKLPSIWNQGDENTNSGSGAEPGERAPA